jgi:propanol-preferring alcohol dehydrogenase
MQLKHAADIDRRPLRSVNLPLLEPGPGQVLLQVRVCGVCHTDLHIVEGDLTLPRLPLVPGHQVVATVQAIGSGVTKHDIGDRVGVAWLYQTCGRCRFCLAGEENLCPEAQFTGYHADGGYGEQMVVDEAFAYPLPDSFSDAEAAPLLCAGIIGYRSLRLSGVRPGDALGMYGFGASAHLAIQVARHWGCRTYVFTRGQSHRRLAADLGAHWVGGAEDVIDQQLDGSVIFAPAGSIVPQALGHLRPGGVAAINAIHMSPIPAFEYRLLYGERVLRSVANFTRRDAEDFLQLAARIPVEARATTYPLLEANRALSDMKASRIDGAAVLQVI